MWQSIFGLYGFFNLWLEHFIHLWLEHSIHLRLEQLHQSDFQGGVEMRQLGPHSRTAHSPQVSASKVDNLNFRRSDCTCVCFTFPHTHCSGQVRSMGGVATPLAGQMLPTVSSPGRQVFI